MTTIYDQIPMFSATTPEWQGWNKLLDAARCCDQNAQYQVDIQPIFWLETDNGTGYWEAVSHASLTPLVRRPGTRLMKAQFGKITEVSV